jgi:hypothetical protein
MSGIFLSTLSIMYIYMCIYIFIISRSIQNLILISITHI